MFNMMALISAIFISAAIVFVNKKDNTNTTPTVSPVLENIVDYLNPDALDELRDNSPVKLTL